MMSGEIWTRWTIRIALALYTYALIVLSKRGSPTVARAAWTLACLALVAHVGFAFHFYHSWSHDIAYATTARQTAEIVGLNWGGGIYANYALAIVWTMDVVWWWANPASRHARPRIMEWGLQGFLAFMFFNATVVFGSGMIRWAGLAVFVLLTLLGVQQVSQYIRMRQTRQ
jgi:hypothetical protein